MTSKIIEISTKEQFDSLVSAYQHPIIVMFSASWCRPCQQLEAQIEDKLSCSFGWLAIKIDIENEQTQDLMSRHDIEAIPYVFLYQSGDILEDENAYFQGNNSQALSRLIDIANKNSPQPLYQSSL